MLRFKEIKESVLQVLYPHVCSGCGSDLVSEESELCFLCLDNLPETNFINHTDNPVEKMFWGRLNLTAAAAQYYFTKESLMQHLIHQLKYKGNKDIGWFLGRVTGKYLASSDRFNNVDALVPLPLHASKEKRRGYNQAAVLCQGMSDSLNIPVLSNVIIRTTATETQTKKGRIDRWQNMEGRFELINPHAVRNKHLLLVDDVITTGATLEACGQELLQAENVKLSIVTLCVAST